MNRIQAPPGQVQRPSRRPERPLPPGEGFLFCTGTGKIMRNGDRMPAGCMATHMLPDWLMRMERISGDAKIAYVALAESSDHQGVSKLLPEEVRSMTGMGGEEATAAMEELIREDLITRDDGRVQFLATPEMLGANHE